MFSGWRLGLEGESIRNRMDLFNPARLSLEGAGEGWIEGFVD